MAVHWTEEIRQGKTEVLQKIYLEHRRAFLHYAQLTYPSLPIEEIKEIFQLSVVVLYDNAVRGKIAERASSLKTYLFAIGKNKVKEYLNTAKKHKTTNEALLDYVTEDIEDIEYKKAMEVKILAMDQALNEVGDPCRQIIRSFYYRQWSMDKIGKALGYSNSDTVKNLKYKCLRRIQKLFKDQNITLSIG